jgi:hypothetical protein
VRIHASGIRRDFFFSAVFAFFCGHSIAFAQQAELPFQEKNNAVRL